MTRINTTTNASGNAGERCVNGNVNGNACKFGNGNANGVTYTRGNRPNAAANTNASGNVPSDTKQAAPRSTPRSAPRSAPRKTTRGGAQPETYTIAITGNKLTRNWWGMAWQNKILSYSDYANRLPRARTYVRTGKVQAITVMPNCVMAQVQGSRADDYTVTITIDPLSKKAKDQLTSLFKEHISSMHELLTGAFPKSFADELLGGTHPLFPTPNQLHLQCTCPDWACVCKHIGAVLYGIGIAFDSDPSLFFKLRNLKLDKLVQSSIDEHLDSYLEKAALKSTRHIDESAITSIFGEL